MVRTMLNRSRWLRWRRSLIFFQNLFRRIRMRGFVERRVVAAVILQRCCSSWKVRQDLRRRQAAASQIRSVWVGGVVREYHSLCIQEAIRLQAWVRGMQKRQMVMRKRLAAPVIQSFVRRSQRIWVRPDGRTIWRIDERRRSAAVTLTKVGRGFYVRALFRVVRAAAMRRAGWWVGKLSKRPIRAHAGQ